MLLRFCIILILITQTLVSYQEVDFYNTEINWEKNTITSKVEITLPRIVQLNSQNNSDPNVAVNLIDARNKAKEMAFEILNKNLISRVGKLSLDGTYTIREKMEEDDEFLRIFNLYFENITPEYHLKYFENKLIATSMIKLHSEHGLLNYIFRDYNTEKFPEYDYFPVNTDYTGLIVDATHLDLKPSLFPSLTDENGIEFYSYNFLEKSKIIQSGMVAYQMDPKKALSNVQKVGKNPFYTTALTVNGKNKTNLSLSSEDIMKFLSSKSSRESLRNCNVIIVIQ